MRHIFLKSFWIPHCACLYTPLRCACLYTPSRLFTPSHLTSISREVSLSGLLIDLGLRIRISCAQRLWRETFLPARFESSFLLFRLLQLATALGFEPGYTDKVPIDLKLYIQYHTLYILNLSETYLPLRCPTSRDLGIVSQP